MSGFTRRDALASARIVLPVMQAAARPSVPLQPAVALIGDWRRSPAFVDRPDPALRAADGDNKLWAFTRSGTLAERDSVSQWRLYRAILPVRRRIRSKGGRIVFAAIAGRAQLWIDGKRVATKDQPASGMLATSVPSDASDVALLVQSAPDSPSGIEGAVRLEAC